ncbi:DUF1146 family protein [Anaerobacillus isosaccharinicus]|uniref:DUF1146 domain-containing protein n=1 Tax=Anaerobacillus isosaccharinicus TaxID=1532552 RepID=A0A1S2M993_9BACI|nr:DUF1146 family protein [Anaerobacillus isosaccharinicus]MBA5584384.1 DUF1146 domain-containing protein [Anaerobacillus isosaccharinicus]QOY37223.1 DUF1146 domain-containing protein [Anaerobacillus isosaccharinicus]
MLEQFGHQALVHLIVSLMFLVIIWWALQAFRFEVLVKNPKSPQGIVLMIITTIALTQLVSTFFLDYLNYSKMLRFLF